ncbi:MAG: hypothetical protein QOG00_253 [Pyrinomonadaceae bacterium]|nr:hypothetical protein [Pyrinomonadaceae bacterium]
MNSWRTSVIGAVLIVGALASLGISALVNRRAPSADELMFAGATIATGLGLINARDNNKSSEDVGAHGRSAHRRATSRRK